MLDVPSARYNALQMAINASPASADAATILATAHAFLAFVEGGTPAAETPPATTRRRTAKEVDPTDVQERMQEVADKAKAGTIDAGTGKPVEKAPAPAVDRDGAKKKAGLLMVAPGGNDALTALLRKHSGITDGAVKFGNVPDDAIPAFVADVDAQLALAD